MNRTDIAFFYSGGSTNRDPNLSFGGRMSIIPAPSNLDQNLFSAYSGLITTSQSFDYRALYVMNMSFTETFYDVHAWIEEQTPGGPEILIGVPVATEEQKITITEASTITGGVFTLKFNGVTTEDISWSGLAGTATNIEAALNALEDISNLTVTGAAAAGDQYEFTVTFGGIDQHKLQPTIVPQLNLLTFSGSTPTISVADIVNGRPINDIATDIGFGNNAPLDVTFVETDASSPIAIGSLAPQDTFYVWLRRKLDRRRQKEVTTDSFTLRIGGNVQPDQGFPSLTDPCGFSSGWGGGFC